MYLLALHSSARSPEVRFIFTGLCSDPIDGPIQSYSAPDSSSVIQGLSHFCWFGSRQATLMGPGVWASCMQTCAGSFILTLG